MFGSDSSASYSPAAVADPVASPPSYQANGGKKPAGTSNATPGFGSTLMTSPLGVTSPAPVERKSLLGS